MSYPYSTYSYSQEAKSREYNERGKRMRGNPLFGKGFDDAYTVTASGKKVYYAGIEANNIKLSDIATSLSVACRWLGALGQGIHYSTAEHSVLMADHAISCRYSTLPEGLRHRMEARNCQEEEGVRKAFAMALLFHDAEEYITGDFPSPLKQFFPLFVDYSDYVRDLIFEKYHVNYGYYQWVKEWDRKILFTEAAKWLVGGAEAIRAPYQVPMTLGVSVYGWSASTARSRFESTYLKLI
jgi:hypothetical protein